MLDYFAQTFGIFPKIFCLSTIQRLVIDRILKKCLTDYNRDFDVAYYTLSALNSQAYVWIGAYYSPFLTILQIVKLILVFFIQCVS